MTKSARVVALALLALLAAPAAAQNVVAGANVDVAGGIRVRVGVPYVGRGPGAPVDSSFTGFRLPDGRYRGFTALASTIAIDGKEPYSMGGAAVTVLKPGPPGSPSSCGQWLNHVELQGNTLLGWIHNETACNYAKARAYASMTFATSPDYGLTWRTGASRAQAISRPAIMRVSSWPRP